jgi:hypothetical protein
MQCEACAQVEPFREVAEEPGVFFCGLWRGIWGACE